MIHFYEWFMKGEGEEGHRKEGAGVRDIVQLHRMAQDREKWGDI